MFYGSTVIDIIHLGSSHEWAILPKWAWNFSFFHPLAPGSWFFSFHIFQSIYLYPVSPFFHTMRELWMFSLELKYENILCKLKYVRFPCGCFSYIFWPLQNRAKYLCQQMRNEAWLFSTCTAWLTSKKYHILLFCLVLGLYFNQLLCL